MPRRSPPFAAALAAALAVGALVGACGSSPPPGTIKGAGGVRYQWPPLHTAGPPSTSRFCSLLTDDYQHLKSISAQMSPDQRVGVLRDFTGFTPTVLAAAPSDIAAPAALYVEAEANVLLAAVAARSNPATFDRATLVTLDSAPVKAAQTRLEAYAANQCHYDLSADAALAPKAPHPTSLPQGRR